MTADDTPVRGGDPPSRGSRIRWRPWLRALHRDAGYLAVGLTFIYAISGLAVNHVGDGQWDPNFVNYERVHVLDEPWPDDDAALAAAVAELAQIEESPVEVYRASDTELEVVFEQRTLYVDTASGEVLEEGQRDRLMLRAANWLHLNRGKAAWTWIADGYAVFLLFLATSGMFMLPGKKGLRGRGAMLVGLGVAIPVLYVTLSGGP